MSLSQQIAKSSLSSFVLENGGFMRELTPGPEWTSGNALTNPSILSTSKGRLLVNVRMVDYFLYLNYNGKLKSPWGGFAHLWHDLSGQKVQTTNFVASLDNELNIQTLTKVDTSECDEVPKFNVVGLEDARLIDWNGEIFQVGSRRDHSSNGEAVVEMARIEFDSSFEKVREVSRTRIASPDGSYAEKNWMPVENQAFKFIRWPLPTEIIQTDATGKVLEISHSKNLTKRESSRSMFGGTQLISWGEYFIALTHVHTYADDKQRAQNLRIYKHFLCVWDQDLNLIGCSEYPFHLLGNTVEFASGIAAHNDRLIISLGFIDSCALLISIPGDVVESLISEVVSS